MVTALANSVGFLLKDKVVAADMSFISFRTCFSFNWTPSLVAVMSAWANTSPVIWFIDLPVPNERFAMPINSSLVIPAASLSLVKLLSISPLNITFEPNWLLINENVSKIPLELIMISPEDNDIFVSSPLTLTASLYVMFMPLAKSAVALSISTIVSYNSLSNAKGPRAFFNKGPKALNPALSGEIVAAVSFFAAPKGFIMSVVTTDLAFLAAAVPDKSTGLPALLVPTNFFSNPNLFIASLVKSFPDFRAFKSVFLCVSNFSCDSLFWASTISFSIEFCLAASFAAFDASLKAPVNLFNPGIASVIASNPENNLTPLLFSISFWMPSISSAPFLKAVILSSESFNSLVWALISAVWFSAVDNNLIDCSNSSSFIAAFCISLDMSWELASTSPYFILNNCEEMSDIPRKDFFPWFKKVFCLESSWTLRLNDWAI